MPFSFLSGLKVLDLSQYLPGPLATQVLSDMGADVVKIEPPAGDPLVRLNPMSGPVNALAAGGGDGLTSSFYGVLNAGKQVLRLDLKSTDGKSAFSDLVANADVILESFRPGVMERLGFDYEAARRLNPAIIYCSLTGYGQTGPRRLAAGHDLNYMASSGALGVAGTKEYPAMAWPPMADCGGAIVSALSILGALVQKGRTGLGAYLDVAMADCVLSWQAMGLTADKLGQAPDRGDSLLTGGAACYRVYKTADGEFLSVGALEEVFWQNFCEALDRRDWISRQWEAMPQNGLINEVAAQIAENSLEHWMAVLSDVETCIQPVIAYAEIANQDQVKARGLLRDKGIEGVEVLLPFLVGTSTSGDRQSVQSGELEAILVRWAGS